MPPRKQPIYAHTKFKSLQYLNVIQHRIVIQVTGGVKKRNLEAPYIGSASVQVLWLCLFFVLV